MDEYLRVLTSLTMLALLQLCSCATAPEPAVVPAANFPAEVSMNKFSRFMPYLSVMVRLENGTEFKCYLDTGSPSSVLPKLVEPQLGKRIGTHRIKTLDGSIEKENIYAAPKIYLGGTQLVTGDRIGVWNLSEGILGMDCLRNYCFQLDFQTGKIRFRKSGDINPAELGRAIPLTSLRYAYIRQNGFFGLNHAPLLIDTGDPFDGMMSPKLLKRAIAAQKAQPVPVKYPRDFTGRIPKLEIVSFPACVWNGETYTNLMVQAGQTDIIGLKFLTRHQVTFDFPRKVMYLKYLGEGRAPFPASP